MGAFVKWLPTGAVQFKFMYFDVVTSETHEGSCFISDHPVEKGADISDHVRDELDKVTLEVFISNAPLGMPNTPGVGDGQQQSMPIDPPTYTAPLAPTPGAVFNAIGGALSSLLSGKADKINANVLVFGDTNYVAQTLEAIRDLKTSKQLVNLVTSEHMYDSMILENYTLPRDASSGTGGAFTLSFKQMRIVESKVVSAPVPTEPRAKVPVARGAKGPQDTDANKSSVLNSLMGAAGY